LTDLNTKLAEAQNLIDTKGTNSTRILNAQNAIKAELEKEIAKITKNDTKLETAITTYQTA
jgi:exonuclease VII small subunit